MYRKKLTEHGQIEAANSYSVRVHEEQRKKRGITETF